ncbi:MAG TPA: cell envelope integrity protein CreD [Acidobacteriaceae bacterium]|nr:cell envelope integrity protein CreD [Acidobacteriaceae bacterium]
MSEWTGLPSSLSSRLRTWSMGMKLIVVCFLALLMLIPALLVESLIQDRKSREADVVKEISQYVGGEQTFLGPVLAIPHNVPGDAPGSPSKHGTYLVFPVEAAAVVRTTTEERRRSLFKVPGFRADLKLDSTFDLTGVPAALPGATLDWSRAEIVVGVSDARGALADATLTTQGKTYTLTPAESALDMLPGGDPNTQLRLMLFGTHVPDLAAPNAQFSVSSALHFSGAQRIAVLAWGKTTRVTEEGDWKNPGFDGGFLPVNRTVTQSGFTAEWSVPFIARGVRAEGSADTITSLDATALGVSFVEVADPYQSVNRSLKYVPLFLGLVFLAYFIFEVTTGRRVHPAQYLLVGMAQIIFYLLLLSFAERVGFDFGFLIAGIASVALLAANAGWIFASRRQGFRALVLFSLLYLLIYLLLRLEDNALLVGALGSFAAVAAAMYFTRNIDWYSSLPQSAAPSAGEGDAK